MDFFSSFGATTPPLERCCEQGRETDLPKPGLVFVVVTPCFPTPRASIRAGATNALWCGESVHEAVEEEDLQLLPLHVFVFNSSGKQGEEGGGSVNNDGAPPPCAEEREVWKITAVVLHRMGPWPSHNKQKAGEEEGGMCKRTDTHIRRNSESVRGRGAHPCLLHCSAAQNFLLRASTPN